MQMHPHIMSSWDVCIRESASSLFTRLATYARKRQLLLLSNGVLSSQDAATQTDDSPSNIPSPSSPNPCKRQKRDVTPIDITAINATATNANHAAVTCGYTIFSTARMNLSRSLYSSGHFLWMLDSTAARMSSSEKMNVVLAGREWKTSSSPTRGIRIMSQKRLWDLFPSPLPRQHAAARTDDEEEDAIDGDWCSGDWCSGDWIDPPYPPMPYPPAPNPPAPNP